MSVMPGRTVALITVAVELAPAINPIEAANAVNDVLREHLNVSDHGCCLSGVSIEEIQAALSR